MLRDLKIGTKIMGGFIVVTFTPLIIVGYLSFSNARDILERAAITELEAIATLKANAIEAFLGELKVDLKAVQDDFNVKTNLPIVAQFFNDRSNSRYISAQLALDSQLKTLKAVKGFSDIKLADQEGKIVYSANGFLEESEGGESFFRLDEAALKEGQKGIYFSDIFLDSVSNDFAMFGAAPIHDFNGTFVGLIVFAFNVGRVYDIIQDTTGLGATGETLVGRNEGDYALFINPLRHDPDAALKRKAVFGKKEAFSMQEAVQGRNGFGLSVDYRSEQVIAVWRYIPSLQWGMVTKIDTAEAFAPVFALRNKLLFINAIVLSISLLLAYYITRLLSKPVDQLEEAKVKNEAILENIGDGMIVTDQKDRIVMINKQSRMMLNWNPNEVIGKSLSKIFPLEDEMGNSLRKDLRPVQSALSSGKKVISDIYYVRKGKRKFPVAITASPIVLNGKIVGGIVVFRDVTKEKEIDRAKTEFISLASHQLRTPLTAINWLMERIKDGKVGKLNKNQKEYLEDVYLSSRQMTDLVDDLLNISRIELGTFVTESQPTNIIEIAESVFSQLAPQIQEKKLKIVKNYGKNIPIINIDPMVIRIVFQNLLSNSVKYTPAKGRITTEISLQEDYHREEQNSHIFIKVQDTGYGIPKYQQSKIFTKMFRADNVREKEVDGTGIGLYIAKSMLERSGGKIRFESEENKGTTFYITIPLKNMKSS